MSASKKSGFLLDREVELAFTGPTKAAVMLLIVLYHSCALWLPGGWFNQPPATGCAGLGTFAAWLNTVHVPVFVFVSGYIYSYLKRETHKYDSAGVVLGKKVRRLLVPYAFVCVFWAAPFYIAYFGWEGIATKYLLAASPSQLWFLIMLFMLFCLFELLSRFAPEAFGHSGAMFAALLFVCYAAAPVGFVIRENYFQVLSVMGYAVIFYAGWLARDRGLQCLWDVPIWTVALVDAALFRAWLTCSQSEALSLKAFGLLLLPFVRLAGVALALSVLARLFSRFPKLTSGGGLL